MDHNPEDVAARIRNHSDIKDGSAFEDETTEKLLTTLVGYDPRARLLSVFLMNPDQSIHQLELIHRGGLTGVTEFEAAVTDLLRLDVIEIADIQDGIPFYTLNKMSDTVAAVDHVQNALMNEQINRLSDEYGPQTDTDPDSSSPPCDDD